MQRVREIVRAAVRHRAFVPVVIAVVAITIGALFAIEHTRNILKIRGPYVLLLGVVVGFPIFAFRFFEPHEDARPMSAYFIATALYYIFLGAPNVLHILSLAIFERIPPGGVKQTLLGLAAFVGIAGTLHFVLRLWWPAEEPERRFMGVSLRKFFVYALLHVFYLNIFISLVRRKFGMFTVLS